MAFPTKVDQRFGDNQNEKVVGQNQNQNPTNTTKNCDALHETQKVRTDATQQDSTSESFSNEKEVNAGNTASAEKNASAANCHATIGGSFLNYKQSIRPATLLLGQGSKPASPFLNKTFAPSGLNVQTVRTSLPPFGQRVHAATTFSGQDQTAASFFGQGFRSNESFFRPETSAAAPIFGQPVAATAPMFNQEVQIDPSFFGQQGNAAPPFFSTGISTLSAAPTSQGTCAPSTFFNHTNVATNTFNKQGIYAPNCHNAQASYAANNYSQNSFSATTSHKNLGRGSFIPKSK